MSPPGRTSRRRGPRAGRASDRRPRRTVLAGARRSRPADGGGPGAGKAVQGSVPQQADPLGRPKGLLQQTGELMAALNADLSGLQQEAGSAADCRECFGVPPNAWACPASGAASRPHGACASRCRTRRERRFPHTEAASASAAIAAGVPFRGLEPPRETTPATDTGAGTTGRTVGSGLSRRGLPPSRPVCAASPVRGPGTRRPRRSPPCTASTPPRRPPRWPCRPA